MRVNADQEVNKLKDNDQYGASAFFKLKDDLKDLCWYLDGNY